MWLIMGERESFYFALKKNTRLVSTDCEAMGIVNEEAKIISKTMKSHPTLTVWKR